MRKRYLKVLSLSLLLSTLAFTGCGCSKTIEISFVGDKGTVVRTIKKGQTLNQNQIPATPQVKGKYCLWDEVDFSSLKNDTTINYTCYDSLLKLEANIDQNIVVDIDSEEADLDYIFRSLKLTATLEDGTKKYLYRDDINIDTNGYNKSVSGNYTIKLKYNNKEVPVNIKVKKINNYVTAILDSDKAYLSEGLPGISAITDVPGEIKFDKDQPMTGTGIYSFNWTFTPLDTNKYEIVHGTSAINVVHARSIQTNKADDIMTFEYKTSIQDIIEAIKDGLVVMGEFVDSNNNAILREIDSKYYTIDSDYIAGDAGDNIEFRVIYHENIEPAIIKVNVKKDDNYNISLNVKEKYEVTSSTKLSDINITYDSEGIAGQFKFDEDQQLKIGSYIYSYTFTPNQGHYEVKKGKVTINTYKVVSIEKNNNSKPSYAYNNSMTIKELSDSIIRAFSGRFVYNDGTEIAVDKTKIAIRIDQEYDPLKPGTYSYYISYDNIEAEFEFEIAKRVLSASEFEIIPVDPIDPEHLDIFPRCMLLSKNDDFDPDDFTLEPDFSRGIHEKEPGLYEFYVNIIPNDNISDLFESYVGAIVIGVGAITPDI